MAKKVLDIMALAYIAVFLGVVVWVALWGESPRTPGHLSIESKILVWVIAPVAFGSMWLLVRYAKIVVERFQSVFGSRWKLMFSACVFGIILFFEYLASLKAPLLR
jgi:hypothetical protein